MTTPPDDAVPMTRQDRHNVTPYCDALVGLAGRDWQRLHVPAHQGEVTNAPGLERIVGAAALRLDFPMSLAGLDQEQWRSVSSGRKTPLVRAEELAADAWGARRTWFLTNGASGGNHIATAVVRGLGREFAVQRSVHSSVIDGVVHTGLTPQFIEAHVDAGLGAALGVTPERVQQVLSERPGCVAVYVVSPSYFGGVADVAAIAEVAHAHGVPLVVDEAWGSHFGFHPALPVNAVRLGADLVISSTHKGAGSLTQSAMLQLGSGPFAQRIESLVERVVRSYQSTSCSSLLLASLDLARKHLVVNGFEAIGAAVASAQAIRESVRAGTRFRDATPDILASPDVIDLDPLKIVIDTRGARITGSEAHYALIRDAAIYCELSTPSALLLMVGATSPVDTDRFLTCLDRLPESEREPERPFPLPAACEYAVDPATAFFGDVELVTHQEAVDRISADSLAAYPPGVPNVIPGEILSKEVVQFLRWTGATPSGFVRGANDPRLDFFRVLTKPPTFTQGSPGLH